MQGLWVFFAITVGLALLLLVAVGHKATTLAVLGVSLLIANWALAEIEAMVVIWSIGGFAP